MNILIISPGYPSEMPEFTRGAAEVGARVFGIGDQPQSSLPSKARHALFAYLQVPSIWHEPAVIDALRSWRGNKGFDRIECLWEPGMMLAANLRRAFDVPGLTPQQTQAFRDKEVMKQKLDAAGLRTPRHTRAKSAADVWDNAHGIGFPVIVKPIDGAGSADTYRVDSADQLRAVIPRLRHVPEVSVEEFIDGEEFTFDTITINGKIVFQNVAWYRPRPLIARTNAWISPQVVALRNLSQPRLQEGVELGQQVIKALGFQTGITHMEWYRKADGEVVFGEIGARPPGARQVDQMNFACDIDVFREWGRAVCFGRFEADVTRKYNVATIYKRAQGEGTIRAIDGLDEYRRRYGDSICWDFISRPGVHRRNWRQTLISDGFIMVRHPDLDQTLKMADDAGTDIQLFAHP